MCKKKAKRSLEQGLKKGTKEIAKEKEGSSSSSGQEKKDVPKLNMLEILTAQFFHTHSQQYFNKIFAKREDIKKIIESHSNRDEVNILIISDLCHSDIEAFEKKFQKLLSESTGQKKEVLERISDLDPKVSVHIAKFLDNSALAAEWIDRFNPPSSNDFGNYDLHLLYAALDEYVNIESDKKWNIDRTVFKNPNNTGIYVENSCCGVRRSSILWDSNNPFAPLYENRKYDLILLRRGVCYCKETKIVEQDLIPIACCGAARDDNTDKLFLEKIADLLQHTNKSAAYLGGWNSIKDTHKWAEAIASLQGKYTEYTYAIKESYLKKAKKWKLTSGIFISKGRAFSQNTILFDV